MMNGRFYWRDSLEDRKQFPRQTGDLGIEDCFENGRR